MDPIIEGSTTICPPAASGSARGPGTRDREVPFYNPGMAVNRDLSVRLLAAERASRSRGMDVADVLAGAGARSLRWAHEVGGDVVVHANDGDPNAIEAIKVARDRNGIRADALRVHHSNAHAFLATQRHDVVDVDPFGSPMPFLDAAVNATRHDGILCITATDTGALAGTYVKACRRRYAAEPLHEPAWRAEVGLRILMACVVHAAGRHDRAAEPVFAVSRGHWMRVAMRIKDGRRRADEAARSIGYVSVVPETGQAVASAMGAGPLWLGPLHDPGVVQSMQEVDATDGNPETAALLDAMVAEASAPPFWIHPPTLHSRLGGNSMPRRAAILRGLQEAGFETAPCHMDVQGIRTDASPADIARVWKGLTTNS